LRRCAARWASSSRASWTRRKASTLRLQRSRCARTMQPHQLLADALAASRYARGVQLVADRTSLSASTSVFI
jgi:hypothetical protein